MKYINLASAHCHNGVDDHKGDTLAARFMIRADLTLERKEPELADAQVPFRRLPPISGGD